MGVFFLVGFAPRPRVMLLLARIFFSCGCTTTTLLLLPPLLESCCSLAERTILARVYRRALDYTGERYVERSQ